MTINIKKFDLMAIVKKHAITSIFISIIAIAIGVLLCVAPGYTSAIVIWITLGLIALGGLSGVFKFIFPGKGNKRDVAALISSLLVIALFVVLLVCSFYYPGAIIEGHEFTGFEHFSLQIIRFLSIFFGILAFIGGIFSFTSLAIPETNKPLAIVKGIFDVTIGILMCIFPVILWAVGCYLSAVYIFITSIYMIVVACKAIHATNKLKKSGVNVSATVVEAHEDKEDKKD
ncbi:MAG: hypothetical protein MJ213_03915 [Bacilli bacterium]|nr:hypothetical protein [Bacilli bacterium]